MPTENGAILYGAFKDYTAGKITLEQLNVILKDLGEMGFAPGNNALTNAELSASTAGNGPTEANGYGYLDTGTGIPNKVQVVKGKVIGGGVGTMHACLIIAGKVYHVNGETVVD